MRRVVLFLASLAWIGIGCGRSETPKATHNAGTAAQREAAPADELVIGEPILHANLTIFPILSSTPKMAQRFITLDEGLRTGKVEIMEVGMQPAPRAAAETSRRPGSAPNDDPFAVPAAGANPPPAPQPQAAGIPAADVAEAFQNGPDVNRLLVVNRSDRPLYLMPGEIIIGGQQDRAVGREGA